MPIPQLPRGYAPRDGRGVRAQPMRSRPPRALRGRLVIVRCCERAARQPARVRQWTLRGDKCSSMRMKEPSATSCHQLLEYPGSTVYGVFVVQPAARMRWTSTCIWAKPKFRFRGQPRRAPVSVSLRSSAAVGAGGAGAVPERAARPWQRVRPGFVAPRASMPLWDRGDGLIAPLGQGSDSGQDSGAFVALRR